MEREFQRVAIVNRGEPAMRFIHAAREFNQEHGTSLRCIALFTEPDRNATFVREADESVCLGSAHAPDPKTQQLKSSYLDYGRLRKALTEARAEAVWPGWGFVAEDAEFSALCQAMGIVFIGPEADIMRRVGDKISSKLLAEQADVQVVPWSGGPVETISEAELHAERLGYPFFFKATAGGGGRGIRMVHSRSDIPQAFASARTEAFKAFGNPAVFMEQLVTDARHVEVQVVADYYGTIWAVGVRDCTIQRRHQKVLEEAPSPALSAEEDLALREAAVRLSGAVGYHNAGTVEFLYQPNLKRFLFMEMNTRLQVEHPVTECTTGLDLVKLQIHIARGGRLEGEMPPTVGHAIEVRLNAEDPENGFAPAPGLVERFRIPSGPGVRIDTGLTEGDSVASEFDSMIAKIIGYGRNRKEALSRLRRALSGGVVVVRGGLTNKAFLLDLLGRPEVEQAQFDNRWLDRLSATGEHISRLYADIALIQAAIEAHSAAFAVKQKQFYASAVRGRPQDRSEIALAVPLRYCGNSYALKAYRLGPRQYRVEVDGKRIDVTIDRLNQFQYRLGVFGRQFKVVSVPGDLNYRIEVEGVAHRIDRDDGGMVHAPAPAVVISVAVNEGDKVSPGDRIAVLEAMKMEMPVTAPFGGTVRKVMVLPNVQVDTGTPLMKIEPEADDAVPVAKDRVSFGASQPQDANPPAPSFEDRLRDLRQFMLGFDVDMSHTPLLADLKTWAHAGAPDTQQLEGEILKIFVDISSLFHRQPNQHQRTGGQIPSTEGLLFSYLRTLDSHDETLPSSFVESVACALAHYGIHSLDRTQALEDSLLWIYKSHQRIERQVPFIVALLERRLQTPEPVQDESFRTLLDQMTAITSGVYPAVSDLAREVRYRTFDQPLFEQARNQVYSEVEDNLAYLAGDGDSSEHAQRVRALVECPQPLLSVFARHFPSASPAMSQLMLEVLTTRFYGVAGVRDLSCVPLEGHPFVTGEYDDEGKRVSLVTTEAESQELFDVARGMLPLLDRVPAQHEIALDFYLSSPGQIGDAETVQQEIQSVLNEVGFPRAIERIAVALADPTNDHSTSGIQHFTYKYCDGSYQEDKFYRGVHPMIARRMQLWRLANFDIKRLPSVEDVYVIHAVGRDNSKDERLFVLAEVRDLTPVRDEVGRIVQLPHLERMFAEALASIRLFQWQRSPRERLFWNRILLHVWPPVRLETNEFQNIVSRLSPGTEGLGIEQVVVRARSPHPATGELRDILVRISHPGDASLLVTVRPGTKLQPVKPLSEYDQKVIRMRRRGLIYPYEIVKMLTPPATGTRANFPTGEFVEYDLDQEGRLVEVNRAYGESKANIVVGVIRNFTTKYPEGMARVILLGDPSKDLGALAEPECHRIMAAMDLAAARGIPLEWFTLSAGAKISMESGVENMDWIARVLRRIVEFTQAGGEINLIVNGINVGAQPYWNAEATMLMHTRGILVMTPSGAMVLTGKRALDFSGSVSAEDNLGIGGYDRIMGLNGQAQYWANDINEACQILFDHYEHTYVKPGERFPRCAPTNDPIDRDVCSYPHNAPGYGFSRVGEILSDTTNPGRKKGFEIREVMRAVIDQDHAPLERWAGMKDAENGVIWDAHLGTYPVCLIGIESHLLPRYGFVPADGPEQWTAGTLFPLSSKKIARAINAASNNRPVVVLANLSGFDGSPESMRKWQLEYGAEIGRAVVNFKGPLVFCVISRYHGGAYVVFSRTLNENMEVTALEGAYASVIGGAPAAAVVFASEVEARARKDPGLQELNQKIAQATGAEKARLRTAWEDLFKVVHSAKLGEMAAEFDRIHNVHRALAVGALNYIIPPSNLRPYLINAVQRGIERELELAVTADAKIPQMKRPHSVRGPGFLDEPILGGTEKIGPAAD